MLTQRSQDLNTTNSRVSILRYLQTTTWSNDLQPVDLNSTSEGVKIAFKDLLAQIHEQVLLSLKFRIENTNLDWMEQITDNAMQYITDQRKIQFEKLQQESTLNRATAILIEQIFARLQIYSYEFNSSLGGSSFNVTCTKPTFVTEIIKYNKQREPIETITKFRARLSTRNISLVICGNKESIQFFFLPSEEVIGLSTVETQHQPIIELIPILKAGEVEWTINNRVFSIEHHEQLCTGLFTQLIERSKLNYVS